MIPQDSALVVAPVRGPRIAAARARLGELLRFGSVGALAYVVDVAVMNLLRFGPGEILGAKPLTAKVVSVAVATMVAWLGNRYWTFSDRRSSSRGRELAGFAVVNVGGLVIAVGCLWFSHYVLGLTSPLADNISANLVGLVLGTAFRYLAYRRFVFNSVPDADLHQRKVDRAIRNPRSSIWKVGWLRRRTEARQLQGSSHHPPPRSTR